MRRRVQFWILINLFSPLQLCRVPLHHQFPDILWWRTIAWILFSSFVLCSFSGPYQSGISDMISFPDVSPQLFITLCLFSSLCLFYYLDKIRDLLNLLSNFLIISQLFFISLVVWFIKFPQISFRHSIEFLLSDPIVFISKNSSLFTQSST